MRSYSFAVLICLWCLLHISHVFHILTQYAKRFWKAIHGAVLNAFITSTVDFCSLLAHIYKTSNHGRHQLIFSGGQNDCNVLLYCFQRQMMVTCCCTTTRHIFENIGDSNCPVATPVGASLSLITNGKAIIIIAEPIFVLYCK